MAVTISGTNGIAVPLGSASAPAETNTTSSTTGIYYPTSTTLGLSTNGTNAVYIDASQNVGIGTTSPAVKLQIGSSSTSTQSENIDMWGALAGSNGDIGRLRFYNVNAFGNKIVAQVSGARDGNNYGGALLFSTGTQADTTLTERMRIDSSGNLLVGTTSTAGSSAPLLSLKKAGGTAWAVGPATTGSGNNFYVLNSSDVGLYLASGSTAWAANSDERLKTDLVPIENAASKVCSLRAVTGRFKTDEVGTSRAFLIAQDVQAVLPEAVDASDPDKLGVQYTEVIPLLVAAIKELSAEVEALKAKVGA